MNKRHKTPGLLVGITAAALLSACGGGSSSGTEGSASTASTTSAPSAASTTTNGAIQGFGSVVVHGVHYDVQDAAFMVNDTSGRRSQLFVGQRVAVRGVNNGDGTGVAQSVTFDADIKGPVTAIDLANNQFTLLGQTVIVSAQTVFEGTRFAELAVADVVEISGSFDADGTLRANSVELKPATDSTVEVKGPVANLDTANQTFRLKALTVDYQSAVLEPADLRLSNGDFVEVKGTTSARNLIANKVEHEDRVKAEEGDDTEVEGFVESISSDTRFTVAGLTVEYDSDTEFEDASAADLALNAAVEVEGVIDANGVLQADKIEIKTEDERELAIRLKAAVQAVDSDAETIKVLGITVHTRRGLSIKDSRDDVRPFGLGDLEVGDFVEIRAFVSDGTLVARRIERDEAESRVILQSRLDRTDEAANLLVVEGVSVNVLDARFEGKDNQVLTSDEFFARTQGGDLVKVKGDFDGSSTITASAVSIENPGDESDDDDADETGEDQEADTDAETNSDEQGTSQSDSDANAADDAMDDDADRSSDTA